jgi:hypothetical protein
VIIGAYLGLSFIFFHFYTKLDLQGKKHKSVAMRQQAAGSMQLAASNSYSVKIFLAVRC